MANPSYSLDNTTFVTLDGAYVYGGKPKSTREENVRKQSENGSKFIYLLFTMDTITIKFIATEAQLVSHRTLYDAVAGEQFPFYFSLSGAGSSDSKFVRRNAGFDPQEREQPTKISGTKVALYDITYYLEEEIV